MGNSGWGQGGMSRHGLGPIGPCVSTEKAVNGHNEEGTRTYFKICLQEVMLAQVVLSFTQERQGRNYPRRRGQDEPRRGRSCVSLEESRMER